MALNISPTASLGNGILDVFEASYGEKNLALRSWVNKALSNANQPNLQTNAELNQTADQLLVTFTGISPEHRRWRPDGSVSSSDKLMNMIFQRSIVHDFDLIFQRAKKVDPALECSYPLWKRVCYIKLPKIGSAFFGNRLIKLALSVTLVWGSMHLFLMAHEATTQLVAARAIPFLINHTSLQVIRAGNLFISRVEIAANWAFKKPFRTLFYAWLARKVALSLPCRIPLLTATCEQINLFFVVDALFFAPQNIARFAFWEGFNLAVIGWRASRAISKSLKCFADTHQQKNTALCKEKIEKIWKGLFHLQDV